MPSSGRRLAAFWRLNGKSLEIERGLQSGDCNVAGHKSDSTLRQHAREDSRHPEPDRSRSHTHTHSVPAPTRTLFSAVNIAVFN